jgi:archaellum component FlaC
MSLSESDLHNIRGIVEDAIQKAIEPIKGGLAAIRNDIKEIYDRLVKIENRLDKIEYRLNIMDKNFEKLSTEQKILRMYSDLIKTAKITGVRLPHQAA